MAQILIAAFSVWGIAVAWKAMRALRTGTPYVFGMWDGGLMRRGKRLNKYGKEIKVAAGIAMSICSIVYVTRALPYLTCTYLLGFVALFSVVSDYVTEERD
jgi:hypothetical protein